MVRRAEFYNPVNAALQNLNNNLNRAYDRKLQMQIHLDNMRFRTRQMEMQSRDPAVRLRQVQAARELERVPMNLSGVLPRNPGDTKQESKFKGFEPALHQILGRNDVELASNGQIINKDTKQPYMPRRFEANEEMALINIAGFHYFKDPRNVMRKKLEGAERNLHNLENRYKASHKAIPVAGKLEIKEAKNAIQKIKDTMGTVKWQLEATDQSMNMLRDMMMQNPAIFRNPRAMSTIKWMYDKDNARMKELIKKSGAAGALYGAKWYTLKQYENANDRNQRRWVQVSKHPAAGGLGSFVENNVLWRPVTDKPGEGSGAAIRAIDSFIRSSEEKIGRYKGYIFSMKQAEHDEKLLPSIIEDIRNNNHELFLMIQGLPIDDMVKTLTTQIDRLEGQLKLDPYKDRVQAIRKQAKLIQKQREKAKAQIGKQVKGKDKVDVKEGVVTPAEALGVADKPPVKGARKAPDGKWYIQKNGKWYRVD